MKRSFSHTGSALLVLLLIMTVLTLLMQQRLRSGSFSYDVVIMRLQQYKQQWAANALLKYGIAWCKAHISELLKAEVGKMYELQLAWPIHSQVTIPGIITIHRYADGVVVTAALKDSTQVIQQKCCTLVLKPLSVMITKIG